MPANSPQTRQTFGFFGKFAGFRGGWIVFEGVGAARSVKKEDFARAVFKDRAGNRPRRYIVRHQTSLGKAPDRSLNGAVLRDVALLVHRLPDCVAGQG